MRLYVVVILVSLSLWISAFMEKQQPKLSLRAIQHIRKGEQYRQKVRNLLYNPANNFVYVQARPLLGWTWLGGATLRGAPLPSGTAMHRTKAVQAHKNPQEILCIVYCSAGMRHSCSAVVQQERHAPVCLRRVVSLCGCARYTGAPRSAVTPSRIQLQDWMGLYVITLPTRAVYWTYVQLAVRVGLPAQKL